MSYTCMKESMPKGVPRTVIKKPSAIGNASFNYQNQLPVSASIFVSFWRCTGSVEVWCIIQLSSRKKNHESCSRGELSVIIQQRERPYYWFKRVLNKAYYLKLHQVVPYALSEKMRLITIFLDDGGCVTDRSCGSEFPTIVPRVWLG